MREQRFGRYLPVFILILIEVIMMSHDGEGASASMARRWSGTSNADVGTIKPSGTRYQSYEKNYMNRMVPTRGKSALRINPGRIERNEKNVPWPELLLKLSNPIVSNRDNVGDYPLLDSSEENSGNELVVDPLMNSNRPIIDEMTTEAVPDMNKIDPSFQLDNQKPKLELQSPIIEPEINPYFQSNKLQSLLALGLLDLSLRKIASSEMSQEDIIRLEPTSVKRTFGILADLVNFAGFTSTNVCVIRKVFSYMVDNLVGSFLKTILQVISSILNIFNPFNIVLPDPDQLPHSPPSLFGLVFDLSNCLELSSEPHGTTASAPVDNSQGSLLSMLDYFNLFKPATEPPSMTPPAPVDNSPDPSVSILDYWNPFKPATKPPGTTPLAPVDNSQDPPVSILDYWNPFKPSGTTPPALVDKSQDPSVPILDNWESFKPVTTKSRGRTTPPPVDDTQNSIASIIDYLNAFKSTTETPKSLRPCKNPVNLRQFISNYLNPCKPDTDPQTPPQSDDYLISTLGSGMKLSNSFGSHTNLSEPFFPYIDLIENFILDLDPSLLDLLNLENGDTDSFGSNTDILKPARNQPQPFRSVQVAVGPSIQPIDSATVGPLEVTNSPTIESRPAFYPLTRNQSQRPTQEADKCPNIPSDYHQVRGISRAYKLYTSNMNWNNARLKCESEDAQLALPEDQRQYDVIIRYAESLVDDSDLHFYVGFHNSTTRRTWTTVSGNPLPFEKWASDTTDLTGKNCGGILVSDSDVDGFTGEICTVPLPFMCEIMIPQKCA